METKAISLFSSTFCQLKCKYCDYDNNDVDRQKSIVEGIESGKFIQDMKKLAPNIESFGLWGAEPTFTLDLISERIPILVESFPFLKEVVLSSNFINIESIKRFLVVMSKTKLKSRIQFSLDGQEGVMCLNRCGSAKVANKVLDNVYELIDWLGDKEFNLLLTPKSTWLGETFKFFSEHQEEVEKYFELMTDIYNRTSSVKGMEEHKKLEIAPTFAVPGNYSEEDCKNFKVLCEVIKEVRNRRKDLRVFYPQENAIKRDVFNMRQSYPLLLRDRGACSAGRSSFGLNEKGDLCICQRPFQKHEYYEDYDDSTLSLTKMDEKSRLKYAYGGFNFYPELSYSIVTMMVNELAENGSIPMVYKNNKDRGRILALMGLLILACPYDNIMQGSMHLRNLELMRMFGYVEYEKYIFGSL